MNRIALLIVASIALVALFGAGIKMAGGQDGEPIILEPIVKTEECATKFWVQNLGSESAAATCTFKDEYARTLCSIETSITPGGTILFDTAMISPLATGYIGWAEVSADQPIAAEVKIPKCKTSTTLLHGVMKEWGDYVCTSVIKISVELGKYSATSMFVFFRNEEGDHLTMLYYPALTGSEVIDLGVIGEALPSGYKGYIQIFVGPGVSVEAEIVEQRCKITPQPAPPSSYAAEATTSTQRYIIAQSQDVMTSLATMQQLVVTLQGDIGRLQAQNVNVLAVLKAVDLQLQTAQQRFEEESRRQRVEQWITTIVGAVLGWLLSVLATPKQVWQRLRQAADSMRSRNSV